MWIFRCSTFRNACSRLCSGPSGKHTRELLRKLRERIPGLVLRTTFITGFPGESAEDHAEMVEFMTEMGFERAGVFCIFTRGRNTCGGHA